MGKPFANLKTKPPLELPQDYNKLNSYQRKEVRGEYIKRQEGLCYHCNEPLGGPASATVLDQAVNKNLFPEKFFDHPIHLHHNHVTGATIGAVHCYCNAVLWQYHGE